MGSTALLAVALSLIASGYAYHPANKKIDGIKNTDICLWNTNGCSVPLTYFPYKEFFKPACTRHDICYFCGIKFGWSRVNCDLTFYNNMKSLCKLKYEVTKNGLKPRSDVTYGLSLLDKLRQTYIVSKHLAAWLTMRTGTLDHCLNGASLYYNGVLAFGDTVLATSDRFHGYARPFCTKPCARALGDPSRPWPQ